MDPFFKFSGTLTTLHDHVPGCITTHGTFKFAVRHNMPEVSFGALLDGSVLCTFLPPVIMKCMFVYVLYMDEKPSPAQLTLLL